MWGLDKWKQFICEPEGFVLRRIIYKVAFRETLQGATDTLLTDLKDRISYPF